jgi:hypothetical protein
MKNTLLYLALAGLSSTSALAAPSQCALGTLTATFANASTASYTDCTGAWDGNLAPNTAIDIATIIGLEFGLSPAPLIGKTGDATNPWTSDPGSVPSGLLSFASAYGGLFVVGLHGGDQNAPLYPNVPVNGGGDFSLYLFDGSLNGGITSISFNMLGVSVNRNGAGRNLSHAALYGGQVVPRPDLAPVPVPEPTGLALVLTGLVAAGSVRRRTRG